MSMESQSSRGLKRRVASIVVALLVLFYIGYLIYRNYEAHHELRSAALEQFDHETEAITTKARTFYVDRRQDLAILRDRGEFVTYSSSRAHGMSWEYGLRDLLEVVRVRLERFVESRTYGGQPVFHRVVFVDTEGGILTQAGDACCSATNLSGAVTPEAMDPMVLVCPGGRHDVIVNAPFRPKGKHEGQIIACLRPEVVREHLVLARGAHDYAVLVDQSGAVICGPPEAKALPEEVLSVLMTLEPGQAHRFDEVKDAPDLLVQRRPVTGTPISLVRIRPAASVLGTTAPAFPMIGLGLLAVVVVGASLVVNQMLTRNLMLQTRYRESARQSRSIEEKHQLLEREVEVRTQTETALRESERKFRELTEMLPLAIFETDLRGRITFSNPHARELFGYTSEEVAGGLSSAAMLSPEDREAGVDRIRRVGLGETLSAKEYTFLRKDGSRFTGILRSSLTSRRGRPIGIRGFVLDLTDTRQLEAQLHHAQRMESIGTLAGGIAHDFNNLLMGIQGRTSMMLSAEAERPETLEHLRGIEEYVRSASELTKQLLGFARGGKYEVQVTDLNSLIDRQNRLFGRTRKEIRIQARLDEDLPTVEVDRGQFEQVLLNLYVNAWQAMPGGGDLTVETSNVALGAEEVEAFDGRAGEYVRVRVSDTGRGMDEKTKQRVFEPFFSTREKGRGTGLGLASAYGIIANHGGNIEVASEPGRGSTFTIHLPASGKACEPVVEEAAGIRSGQEVVLLVDDESIVRDVGKAMLERLGYAVHVASAGAEAVERLQDLTVDLVILDLVMPDMGGGETFDRIREIRPEMRVLLSSGYSIDGKAREILARGCNGFIQKPFTMQQLSEKIRGVLETP